MAMTSRVKRGSLRLLATWACFATVIAYGQVPVGDDGYPVEALGSVDTDSTYAPDVAAESLLSGAELQVLVGPVALYPDDLLAIVLPASTYPLEIVQAARFLDAFDNDSTLEPDESWDESVIALLNYPEVIHLLDDDIDWTWKLGEAVISQQADLVAAVEAFRDRAYAAGNLKSDEYQTVSNYEGIIEIVPIEDDIIYVPYYEPEHVVIQQAQPVYHYYPRNYPVYYYPYPAGYAFSSGYFWGVTTAFRIGWATDHLHIHHPSYWGHPYYGHSYFGHYYRRPTLTVYNTTYVNNSRHYSGHRYRDGDYWQPRRRSGARQSDYYSRTRAYRPDVRDERQTNTRTVNYTSNRGQDIMRQADTVARRDRDTRTVRADSANTRERNGRGADRRIEFRDRTQTSDNQLARQAVRNPTRGTELVATRENRGDSARQVNRVANRENRGNSARQVNRVANRENRGDSARQVNHVADRNPTRVAFASDRPARIGDRERAAREMPRRQASRNDRSSQRQVRTESAPPRQKAAVRENRQESRESNRSERSSNDRERSAPERSKRNTEKREKRAIRTK